MRKEDEFLEGLFEDLYGEDTFDGALDAFNEELETEKEDASEGEDAVFEGDDEGFDGWLKTHKGDDTLLCWLFDADCGASGPDGFCREVRDRFGEVTLETVRLHAKDLKTELEG